MGGSSQSKSPVNRATVTSTRTPKVVYAIAAVRSRSRSPATAASAVASPKAISHAAITRPVNGVSSHGQTRGAVVGSTNSIRPTTSSTADSRPSATRSSRGTGCCGAGSSPGARSCRNSATSIATGTKTYTASQNHAAALARKDSPPKSSSKCILLMCTRVATRVSATKTKIVSTGTRLCAHTGSRSDSATSTNPAA